MTGTVVNSDPLVPVDIDLERLRWEGNNAHIEGILFEAGRFYKRVDDGVVSVWAVCGELASLPHH